MLRRFVWLLNKDIEGRPLAYSEPPDSILSTRELSVFFCWYMVQTEWSDEYTNAAKESAKR